MTIINQKNVNEKLSYQTEMVIECSYEDLVDIRGALNSAIIRAEEKKYESAKKRYEELEKVFSDYLLSR